VGIHCTVTSILKQTLALDIATQQKKKPKKPDDRDATVSDADMAVSVIKDVYPLKISCAMVP
jgi:hypothetical protein